MMLFLILLLELVFSFHFQVLEHSLTIADFERIFN